MDHEATTYEEHTKKARKNQLLLFTALLCVVAILGSVFLYVACQYNATDFSVIQTLDTAFFCTDGFLFAYESPLSSADFSSDAFSYAASYNLSTGEMRRYPFETLSLSDYGLQGECDVFYYTPSTAEDAKPQRIVPANPYDVPLSRANTATQFVFRGEDGKKYLIDTESRTSTPLFAGSTAQGVDEYGAEITEFSYGGLYAMGCRESELVIYLRGDTESFQITRAHRIDLSKLVGSEQSTAAYFCTESHIQVIVSDAAGGAHYYICNALTGEISPAPHPEETQYDHAAGKSTAYSQLYLPEISESGEENEDDTFRFRYINATLGTEFEHALSETADSAELAAVSPSGEYAFFKVLSHTQSETAELFSKAGEKAVSLAEVKAELIGDCEIQSAVFLSDNIVLLNFSDKNGEDAPLKSVILKLCF